MYRVEMLPAEYGDCLWIEYGDARHPRRILVDCGTAGVYPALRARIESLRQDDRRFELFVVTHVDVDHIGGAIALLRDSARLGVTFGDVWFNGYGHLDEADDTLGALQGEELTRLLVAGQLPWNAAFGGRAVVVPAAGALPVVTLAGGMTLTLVSPGPEQLSKLIPEWKAACAKAGIVPGSGGPEDDEEPVDDVLGDPDVAALAGVRFEGDPKHPNGSSIAFVAEHGSQRALFAADAHAPVLLGALGRFHDRTRGRLALDALKLSHHGSRKNTNVALAEFLACRHVLISTNGKRFRHPNLEAIARIVHHGEPGATLSFNYRTEFNDPWDSAQLRRRHHFETRYPRGAAGGVAIDL